MYVVIQRTPFEESSYLRWLGFEVGGAVYILLKMEFLGIHLVASLVNQ